MVVAISLKHLHSVSKKSSKRFKSNKNINSVYNYVYLCVIIRKVTYK